MTEKSGWECMLACRFAVRSAASAILRRACRRRSASRSMCSAYVRRLDGGEAKRHCWARLPRAVDTVYFGGGTPSLLEPEQFGGDLCRAAAGSLRLSRSRDDAGGGAGADIRTRVLEGRCGWG